MASSRVVNKESDRSSTLDEGSVIMDPGLPDISSHEDSDEFDPDLRSTTPTPVSSSSRSFVLPHNIRQRSDSSISQPSTSSTRSWFGAVKQVLAGRQESTNKKLKNEIQDLSDENTTLRKAITKLSDENTVLKKVCQEKDVQFQGIQTSLGIYQKKLEVINRTQFKGTLHGKNIQIGNNNLTVINDDVNGLLLSYNQNLEHTLEDLNNTSKRLADAQKCNEESTSTLQEIVENLSKMNSSKAPGSIDLEYTIRLVDPTQMMVDCIRTINKLPKGKYYDFNDIPQEGQLGILRLLKLHQRDVVIERLTNAMDYTEQLDGDRKEQDQCGALFVEWVHYSPNNTVKALMDIFPRLKRPRRVSGPPGQGYSTTSLTKSTLDLSHDDIREDLLSSVKSMNDKINSIESIVSSSSTEIKEIKQEVSSKKIIGRNEMITFF